MIPLSRQEEAAGDGREISDLEAEEEASNGKPLFNRWIFL